MKCTGTFIIVILEDNIKHSVILLSRDQIKGLKRKETAFTNVERMTKHSCYVSNVLQTFCLHSSTRYSINKLLQTGLERGLFL